VGADGIGEVTLDESWKVAVRIVEVGVWTKQASYDPHQALIASPVAHLGMADEMKIKRNHHVSTIARHMHDMWEFGIVGPVRVDHRRHGDGGRRPIGKRNLQIIRNHPAEPSAARLGMLAQKHH